jgi:hypothetical protein
MIIVILQILISLYLLFLVLGTLSTYGIKLNSYNVSIGILIGVFLILCMAVSYKDTKVYLAIGLIIGIISELLNFFKVKEMPEQGLFKKIIMLLTCLILWPQVLTFLYFMYKNMSKMHESIES